MALQQPVAYRFSVDEYHRMADAGIFGKDDRVELLDGEVVQMMTIGPPHAACVDRLNRLFTAGLRDRVIVRVQGPIIIGDFSEPEPDISILVAREDFYVDDHPRPPEVLLLVEVADASLAFDRKRKLPLYAAGGIEEAWLVDIPGGVIDVHRGPSPAGYQERTTATAGDSIAPLAFADLSFAVSDILGPTR